MGLHACYCCYVVIVIVGIVVIVIVGIVVIVARTYVCMLLLMMVALVFSHPTRHETMKLLLASATSLVTRVAYGRLKNCQAQRANQASDSSLPRGFQLPPPPSWRWMGSFHFLLAFPLPPPPSWRWMGGFHFMLAFRFHRPRAGAGWAASASCLWRKPSLGHPP